MANPLPQNSPAQDSEKKLADGKSNPSPTPLRCFTGAIMAGGISTLLYSVTQSIIQVFANKPLPTNPTTANIAVAVRTLVIGLSTLATAIFAISAVGLVALGIQLWVKQLRQPAD
jgi:Protein of unknown function (DUF3082)